MAIAGLLAHCEPGRAAELQAALAGWPGFTSHGAREDQYLALVLEAPAARMEALVRQLEAHPAVLTVYTTYLSVEDEVEAGGTVEGLTPGVLGQGWR